MMDSNQNRNNCGLNTLSEHQHLYNSKRYDKIRVLGEGSFGTAVVHRRRADCSLVVLKEIDLKQFKGDKEKSSALNEAKIMSTLDHVNIIKFYNAYITDTKLLIEMEYASMGTLANYLSLQTTLLNEHEILIIFGQIVSGLSYLHNKSIVHMDLKMANIFITIEGLIKVGDFGIAKYMSNQQSDVDDDDDDDDSLDDDNHIDTNKKSKERAKKPRSHRSNNLEVSQQYSHQLGTLAYSSPERYLGKPIDYKSDIWSLGCILYELITSKPLFTGNSLPEIVMRITRIQYDPIERTNITSTLRETFERTISLEPEDRPTAHELHSIIGELLPRLQLHKPKIRKPAQNHGVDLSNDAAAATYLFDDDKKKQPFDSTSNNSAQLQYPHSLIYQVRLNSRHIQMNRVNLPPTKRIKEMSKGKSHYLVLTYDSIVFGWGDKSHGQLGSCGLSNTCSAKPPSRKHATIPNCINTAPMSSTLASSINKAPNRAKQQESVTDLLEGSQAGTKPFIINELNHRKIVQVAAGNSFSVFLSKTGIVMACGDGSQGCLGRGDFRSSFTPRMVESLLNTDVVAIACGPSHVVAVCGNGKAFAWGKFSKGRLGIGNPSARSMNDAAYVSSSDCALSSHLDRKDDHERMRYQNHRKLISRPQPIRFANDDDDDDNSNVFIKNVFCGDKCTIFIDSKNHCWACGENRFNKLGLDIKRRFKKTLIVENCWYPTEITSLSKYQIINCNIGKNHSTFISSEGKLFVYGQDIDQTYRLKSNIICAIDSHRRISFELQTKKRNHQASKQIRNLNVDHHHDQQHKQKNIINQEKPKSYRQLTKSTLINNQSSEFKHSKDNVNFGHNQLDYGRRMAKKYPRYPLNKMQRQQIDTFIKKSRSYKKMPFECVIGVSCTSKFTLALTNDNRIYFWGTRSYASEQISRDLCPNNVQLEPQLLPSNLDECFIKIGTTNRSLMNTIQVFGSDQPIIHAKDPRLTADTLADLWILDYRPSTSSSESSSSSSSSSSSGSSLHADDDYSCSCSLVSSCCDDCCDDGQSSRYLYNKHDAILEPQPIVSLYVPPMFNHNGCVLQLVDLFCFDEDKFYLVLDTTVKMNQLRKPTMNQANQNDIFGQPRLRLNSINENVDSTISGKMARQMMRQKSSSETESDKLFDTNRPKDGLDIIAESSANSFIDSNRRDKQFKDYDATKDDTHECPKQLEDSSAPSATSADDNNNYNKQMIRTEGRRSGQQILNDCTDLIGGASLDEPRSISTFLATSMGNHIIVRPEMRGSDDEPTLEPIRFGDESSKSIDEVDHETSGTKILPSEDEQSMNGSASIKINRRKFKLPRKESESTSCTFNETSPMPSWVKNEYNMQQRQQDHDDCQFVVDSASATDATELDESTSLGDLSKLPEPEDGYLRSCSTIRRTSLIRTGLDNHDVGVTSVGTSVNQSKSQPDIRNVNHQELYSKSIKTSIQAHSPSTRSLANLEYNRSYSDNLLSCDVYRFPDDDDDGTDKVERCSLNLSDVIMMSGSSTTSSSNNPLISSTKFYRKMTLSMSKPRELIRRANSIADDGNDPRGHTRAFLWTSNSKLLADKSSSSTDETRLDLQTRDQRIKPPIEDVTTFSKSLQQLNVDHKQTKLRPEAQRSINSLASSIRKSLLKLFC